DRLGRTLAGTGVGMGALAMDRQSAAMAQAAIAAQIHQALDVHRDLATQIALDSVVAVDSLANAQHFVVRQRVDATRQFDADLAADLTRLGRTDAVDILQGDFHTLIRGDVDASYTGQFPNSFNVLERGSPPGFRPRGACESARL